MRLIALVLALFALGVSACPVTDTPVEADSATETVVMPPAAVSIVPPKTVAPSPHAEAPHVVPVHVAEPAHTAPAHIEVPHSAPHVGAPSGHPVAVPSFHFIPHTVSP